MPPKPEATPSSFLATDIGMRAGMKSRRRFLQKRCEGKYRRQKAKAIKAPNSFISKEGFHEKAFRMMREKIECNGIAATFNLDVGLSF